MPKQINATADFYLALESDITGAKAANDGTTSIKASTSPGLAVGYYNASLPTLSNGTAGAFQLDSSGRLIVAPILQSGTWTVTGAGGTFPVTDSGGSLTVDAPVGTPVFVRLSDGTSAIATLPVSLAALPALSAGANAIGSITNTSFAATQSGNWSTRLQDGSGNLVTSTTRGSERALSVQILDGSGGQITNFAAPPAGIAIITTPTLDTAAYAVSDVLFVQNTLANATVAAGGQGVIESVTVVDADDVAPAFTLVFFRDTITIATVNSAWNVSDADMSKAIGFVSFVASDFKDFGVNRVAVRNTYLRFSPASGTSIYCAAFADGTPTHTASGLTITTGIRRES